jgi:hypothetical protein
VFEFVPRRELDARATLTGSTLPLEGIDRLPPWIENDVHPTLREEIVESSRARARAWQHAATRVLEQEVDGLGGVLLVRPDDPGGPALDPARAVQALNRGCLVVEHAPARVRHRSRGRVERDAR